MNTEIEWSKLNYNILIKQAKDLNSRRELTIYDVETIIKCIENEILNLKEGHDTVLIDIAKAEEEIGFFSAVLVKMKEDLEHIKNTLFTPDESQITREIEQPNEMTSHKSEEKSLVLLQKLRTEGKKILFEFSQYCNMAIEKGDSTKLLSFCNTEEFKNINIGKIHDALRSLAENGCYLAFITIHTYSGKDQGILEECLEIAQTNQKKKFIKIIRNYNNSNYYNANLLK